MSESPRPRDFTPDGHSLTRVALEHAQRHQLVARVTHLIDLDLESTPTAHGRPARSDAARRALDKSDRPPRIDTGGSELDVGMEPCQPRRHITATPTIERTLHQLHLFLRIVDFESPAASRASALVLKPMVPLRICPPRSSKTSNWVPSSATPACFAFAVPADGADHKVTRVDVLLDICAELVEGRGPKALRLSLIASGPLTMLAWSGAFARSRSSASGAQALTQAVASPVLKAALARRTTSTFPSDIAQKYCRFEVSAGARRRRTINPAP